jgi:hypothetical protein
MLQQHHLYIGFVSGQPCLYIAFVNAPSYPHIAFIGALPRLCFWGCQAGLCDFDAPSVFWAA